MWLTTVKWSAFLQGYRDKVKRCMYIVWTMCVLKTDSCQLRSKARESSSIAIVACQASGACSSIARLVRPPVLWHARLVGPLLLWHARLVGPLLLWHARLVGPPPVLWHARLVGPPVLWHFHPCLGCLSIQWPKFFYWNWDIRPHKKWSPFNMSQDELYIVAAYP